MQEVVESLTATQLTRLDLLVSLVARTPKTAPRRPQFFIALVHLGGFGRLVTFFGRVDRQAEGVLKAHDEQVTIGLLQVVRLLVG